MRLHSVLYKPQRAPSPAPRPSARWVHEPRTPPSSPWGSWCLRSTPCPGTILHSLSFSLLGARTASHSDSIKLWRTEERSSVNDPTNHRRAPALHRSRPTNRFALGLKVGRFVVTAAASVRLPCSVRHPCLNELGNFWRVCGAQRHQRSDTSVVCAKAPKIPPMCAWNLNSAGMEAVMGLPPKCLRDNTDPTFSFHFNIWGFFHAHIATLQLSHPFVWLHMDRYPTPSIPRYPTHREGCQSDPVPRLLGRNSLWWVTWLTGTQPVDRAQPPVVTGVFFVPGAPWGLGGDFPFCAWRTKYLLWMLLLSRLKTHRGSARMEMKIPLKTKNKIKNNDRHTAELRVSWHNCWK